MSGSPDQAPPPTPAAATENARQAGRGAVALSAAKAFFIVLGLGQQIILFRVMGLGSYGALRSAQSPASITYNPIVTTGILGMSRVTSQAGPGEGGSVARALGIHALLSSVVALGFFAIAPWLANELGAPHITTPLQLLAVVIFLYGLYAPLIGVFNGQRRFLHQAGLDMSAAVLRTTGLILGAWYCSRPSSSITSVSGALIGFIVSAVVVLLLAVVLLQRGGNHLPGGGAQGSTWGAHIGFIGPVLVGQVVLNLLLQADSNTLRYFSSRAAAAAALPLTAADPLVGAYSATQLFGFLPYQLMVGLGFILFPMLSKAAKEGDSAAIAVYVRTGVRVSVLVTGLLVSVSAGLPHALLALIFPQAADLGAPAMRILMLGLAAFAVFGALVTVLNSLKHQWLGMIITAIAFALVVLLDVLLLEDHPFNPALLVRTAVGTSLALWATTLITALFVKRAAGAVVPPMSPLRVCLAVLLCVAAADQLPPVSKWLTPLYAVLVAAAYLALLVLMRELTQADFAYLKSMVNRRRKAAG